MLFTNSNPLQKQECIPVGCVPPARYRMGGCLCPGVSAQRGVSVRASLSRGVTAWGSLSGERSLSRGSLSRGGHCLGVIVRGGVSAQGVSVLGSLSGEGSLSRGVSVQGGFCPGGLCPGGSLSRGVSVRGVSLTETPSPSVNRITNTCKNITLPQLRCGR